MLNAQKFTSIGRIISLVRFIETRSMRSADRESSPASFDSVLFQESNKSNKYCIYCLAEKSMSQTGANPGIQGNRKHWWVDNINRVVQGLLNPLSVVTKSDNLSTRYPDAASTTSMCLGNATRARVVFNNFGRLLIMRNSIIISKKHINCFEYRSIHITRNESILLFANGIKHYISLSISNHHPKPPREVKEIHVNTIQ